MSGANIHAEAALLGNNHARTEIASPDLQLHTAIAELVRSVYAESRPYREMVVEQFALLAFRHIPGVAHASVMLATAKHGLRVGAASTGGAHLIDTVQEQTQQGPCLDALTDKRTIRVDDLTTETRWPAFTRMIVSETPVRSMLCYPLYTDVYQWGALSRHATTAHAFDARGEQAGGILATHAALTLHATDRDRQLRAALSSRDIIGQAKGILMERHNITARAAFTSLTELADKSNKPVVLIAKNVVESRPKSRHKLGSGAPALSMSRF